MLTPQEVKSRAFQRASFGGYHMGQVDEFLDVLTDDYTALFNENAVLKSKMKVLVDKVEEYRATEEAMRKALMTAQRMADELVRDAESKKASILADAEAQASQRMCELSAQVEAEEFRLRAAQDNTAAFVEKMRALYAEQVGFLARLEELTPDQPAPALVDHVEEAASEIDDSVQRLLAKAMAEAAAENAAQTAAEAPAAHEDEVDLDDTAEFSLGTPLKPRANEEEMAKTTRIDLAELHFGKDYEIT